MTIRINSHSVVFCFYVIAAFILSVKAMSQTEYERQPSSIGISSMPIVILEGSYFAFSWKGGLIYDWGFSKNWLLQTGIQYGSYNIKKRSCLSFYCEDYGVVLASALEVPLNIGYRFYKKDRLFLYAMGGPVAMLLLKRISYNVVNNSNSEVQYYPNNKPYLLMSASIGISYKLNDFILGIEPKTFVMLDLTPFAGINFSAKYLLK